MEQQLELIIGFMKGYLNEEGGNKQPYFISLSPYRILHFEVKLIEPKEVPRLLLNLDGV